MRRARLKQKKTKKIQYSNPITILWTLIRIYSRSAKNGGVTLKVKKSKLQKKNKYNKTNKMSNRSLHLYPHQDKPTHKQ